MNEHPTSHSVYYQLDWNDCDSVLIIAFATMRIYVYDYLLYLAIMPHGNGRAFYIPTVMFILEKAR
jgi:hypothetical protein